MFCTKCGSTLSLDAKFCARCGAQVQRIEPTFTHPSPMPSVAMPFTAMPAMGSPAAFTSEPGISGEDIYAGFWKRVASYFIDWVLIVIVAFVAGFAGGIIGVNESLMGWVILIGIWLYSAGMESSGYQGTLGKLALGIKVTDMQGNRIGFWRSTGRQAAKILSSLFFCIGYVMAGFTARRQALHDLIARCLVVNGKALSEGRVDSAPEVGRPGGVALAVIVVAALAIPTIGILAAIAIPQYQDYVVRARMAEAYAVGNEAAQALGQYYEAKQDIPADLASVGIREVEKYPIQMNPNNGVLRVRGPASLSITLVPSVQNGKVVWKCTAEGVHRNQVISRCR
jgi:uncharacterized RDD family membrane protein YckC/Tfp pilus assembly major pilin PilA